MISVAKLDSTGEVVSTFRFETGNGEIAAGAAVDPFGNLWIVGDKGLVLKLDRTGTTLLSMWLSADQAWHLTAYG